MSANDTQVGGTHYQSDYQHWDFMARHYGAVWFKGCASKYISRWRKKNGVEDLKKALHYMQKLEELLSTDQLTDAGPVVDAKNFCWANNLEAEDKQFVISIFNAVSIWTVSAICERLEKYIREVENGQGQQSAPR